MSRDQSPTETRCEICGALNRTGGLTEVHDAAAHRRHPDRRPRPAPTEDDGTFFDVVYPAGPAWPWVLVAAALTAAGVLAWVFR